MRIIFLLIGKVVSDAFSLLPVLSKEDMEGSGTFLVYIYYSRPNLHCAACESFNRNISMVQKYIPVKKINFFEDPRVASRFYTFLFPSFVVRDGGRSYHLPVDSFEQLEEIVRNRRWAMFKPMARWMDVNSHFASAYSIANCIFFRAMQKSYVVFDAIPAWVVNFGFSAIIAYMLYSICTIFLMPVEKKKKK